MGKFKDYINESRKFKIICKKDGVPDEIFDIDDEDDISFMNKFCKIKSQMGWKCKIQRVLKIEEKLEISSKVGYKVFKLDNLFLKEDFEELVTQIYSKSESSANQKEIIEFLREIFKDKKNFRYYQDVDDKTLFFFTTIEGYEASESKSGLAGFDGKLFYRKRVWK